MSVIETEPETQDPIANDGFFPDIDPADFAGSVRVDEDVDRDTTAHILKLAIHQVNCELASFKAEKVEAGNATLAGIEAPEVGGISVLLFDYQEAVYTLTKAIILDTYADTDTTVLADSNTESKTSASSPFRARSFAAVMRIIDGSRAQVALI